MARAGFSNRRKRLFEENPHCHYCGTLTIFTIGPKMQPNSATIEHIYPRLHPHRREPNLTNEKRLVIACAKCNNEKSVRDQTDFLTPEQLKLRSMGAKNWRSWAKAVFLDINRFDCF